MELSGLRGEKVSRRQSSTVLNVVKEDHNLLLSVGFNNWWHQ